MRRYRIVDTLLSELDAWEGTEHELLKQYAYLRPDTFEMLVDALEQMGYEVTPVLEPSL